MTDAGLEYLKGLTNLESLELFGTQVTDADVKDLQAAFTPFRVQPVLAY